MKTDKTQNSKEMLWGEYAVPEDTPQKIQIGPLLIWCFRENQEIRLAWQLVEKDDKAQQLPDNDQWQRWAFKQSNPKIEIKPVFPDRPIIVKPENPFKVAEDASVRIFIRMPIWVRISLLGKPVTHLIDLPIVTLSNTWFGTFEEGDLCYWISSGARLDLEPDPERPYMAICPLQLIDRSPEDLNVEKICHRVEYLALYETDGQLWGGETRFIYKGNTEVSQVEYTPGPPREVKKAKLISEARTKPRKSITAKTFSSIKDLPGFGIFSK